MGSRDRLDRVEEFAGDRACPNCGGQQAWEEIQPDGSVVYPFGPPCETCGPGTPYPAPFTIIVSSQTAPARPHLDDEED